MLMPWNKSKLLTDSSSLEIARVTEILKKNGIEYECVTKKNESSLGTMVHGSMGASVGGGGAFTYSQSAGPTSYVYHVFVHKKNMDRAKELIN